MDPRQLTSGSSVPAPYEPQSVEFPSIPLTSGYYPFQQEGISVWEYLRTLYKHRWLILASLVIMGTLINHPIHMGGIPIRPGDIVLGDADGVVVVAAADLTWVLEKCRQRRDKEEKAMEEIRRGKSTLELYGFDKVLNAKGLKEE